MAQNMARHLPKLLNQSISQTAVHANQTTYSKNNNNDRSKKERMIAQTPNYSSNNQIGSAFQSSLANHRIVADHENYYGLPSSGTSTIPRNDSPKSHRQRLDDAIDQQFQASSLKKSKSCSDAEKFKSAVNYSQDVMMYALASLHLDTLKEDNTKEDEYLRQQQQNSISNITKKYTSQMSYNGDHQMVTVKKNGKKARNRNRSNRQKNKRTRNDSTGNGSDGSSSSDVERTLSNRKAELKALQHGLKGSKSSPCFQEETWAKEQAYLSRSASRSNVMTYNRRYLSTSASNQFFRSGSKATGGDSNAAAKVQQQQQTFADEPQSAKQGSTSNSTSSSPDYKNSSFQTKPTFISEPSDSSKYASRLFTVGCGFSKDDNPKIQLESNISSYCITEDSASRNFGEDAAFIVASPTADILGVSDGVGGWRNHGVDPSKFSFGLMEKAKDLAVNGNFKVDQPVQLLSRAYNQLTSVPNLIGSATAVLASFCRKTSTLYTANLGDSGFLVIRKGKIVHRSEPQCHAFNAPFQLALLPKGQQRGSFNDTPQKADFSSFKCEEGDIIILASDGLYDNVHLEHISQLLGLLEVTPDKLLKNFNCSTKDICDNNDNNNKSSRNRSDSGSESVDSGKPNSIEDDDDDTITFTAGKQTESETSTIFPLLEKAASTFVTFARKNAHDNTYYSPFSMEARKYGYHNQLGGKVDDITILISIVGPMPKE